VSKLEIDELARIASKPLDPLTVKLLEMFPEISYLDRANYLYRGEPLSKDQIDFVSRYWDTDLSEEIISIEAVEYEPILKNAVDRLIHKGIDVDTKHTKILREMAMVMAQSLPLRKPVIITTRPGLGKTEMLISTLIEKSKMNPNYRALVVIRRVEDCVKIADQVNKDLQRPVCYVRPTFTLMVIEGGGRCKNGHSKDDYDDGICNLKNCKIHTCRAKKRRKSLSLHNVPIITTAHFNTELDKGNLDVLMRLPSDKGPPGGYGNEYSDIDSGGNTPSWRFQYLFSRDELYIDENPGMIVNPLVESGLLLHCASHLEEKMFNPDHIKEFRDAMGAVIGQMGGKDNYEYVNPLGSTIMLSKKFKDAWKKDPYRVKEKGKVKVYYNIPDTINAFLKYGGIRQKKSGVNDYGVGINRYRQIGSEYKGRTVILDGTGVNDQTYKPEDFNVTVIEEFREFSRATLHRYPLDLSKTLLGTDSAAKIDLIANEAIRVIGDQKALFITYKDYAERFKKKFTSMGNIEVNHFGNLIGSNKYWQHTIVFFAGLNDWGPYQYFSQKTAVKGDKVNLGSSNSEYVSSEMREFYHSQMAVELYQDLMRSNLRVAGKKDPVHIYLWTKRMPILGYVERWLPGIIPEIERYPRGLTSRHADVVSTKAEVTLNKLKKDIEKTKDNTKSKNRYLMLEQVLGRAPDRIEVQHIWPSMDAGHYANAVKKYCKNIV
jgi:hypothetical protein